MRSLLLLFLTHIFIVNFCSGQTYSSVINDKEIYSFINAIIKTDKDRITKRNFKKIKVSSKISKNWDSINFVSVNTTQDIQNLIEDVDYIYWGKHDTLFNAKDKIFMFEQYKSIKDTIWHQAFSRAKFINKRQSKPDKYYFSIPIFSVDKNIAVIYFSNYCGELCGFGGYYFYKRTTKNKWKFITAVGHWIS